MPLEALGGHLLALVDHQLARLLGLVVGSQVGLLVGPEAVEVVQDAPVAARALLAGQVVAAERRRPAE